MFSNGLVENLRASSSENWVLLELRGIDGICKDAGEPAVLRSWPFLKERDGGDANLLDVFE